MPERLGDVARARNGAGIRWDASQLRRRWLSDERRESLEWRGQ